MDPSAHYRDHIRTRQTTTAAALGATGFDAVVIGSGRPFTYFADDADAPFHPVPHFAHWLPLSTAHNLLVIQPGKRPRLIRYAPEDYWYEQLPLGNPFWASEFEIQEAGSIESVWRLLGTIGRAAYIGNESDLAEAAGLVANPPSLTARLDWERSFKSAYEVACLEKANVLALKAHQAARQAFLAGGSELDIHYAFVQALRVVDHELAFTSIVALNEKGATLHYENKRDGVLKGKVLLLDCGARHLGYASDITRTTLAAACDARFRAMAAAVEKLEIELCQKCTVGTPFPDLHRLAHLRIAGILKDADILRADPEESVKKEFTTPFFPCGLGHHLGIQVHDVAGRMVQPDGTTEPPPPEYPFLRTTRKIEAGHVLTIEPGIYFTEMLLRPFRSNQHASRFNWKLIDELSPLGGIRYEDNLVATDQGPRNITRMSEGG